MSFDARTVEMIALGASVAANCHSCIQHHSAKAIDAGLSQQEIKEAMEVGRMIRKGAALSMDKLIADLSGETLAASAPDRKNCGCG